MKGAFGILLAGGGLFLVWIGFASLISGTSVAQVTSGLVGQTSGTGGQTSGASGQKNSLGSIGKSGAQ